MHHLSLKNLGPMQSCELDLNDFTVFTGPQANGKSTVAKAVFFFRTVKDDIIDLMLRGKTANSPDSWEICLSKRLKDKFMQLFGSSYGMSNDMSALYAYD